MRRLSAWILGFYISYAAWALLSLVALAVVPAGSHYQSRAAVVIIAVISIAAGIIGGVKANTEMHAPRTARCRNCGYLLVRLTEPRCPECGEAFDPYELPAFTRTRPESRPPPSTPAASAESIDHRAS